MAVQAHHILPNATYQQNKPLIDAWTGETYNQNAGYNLTPHPPIQTHLHSLSYLHI